MPDISTKTWTRFVTTNFCVTAEVMGSIHKFDFEGHHVSVKLPQLEHTNREPRFDHLASVSSYQRGTGSPLSYCVMKVDVEINVQERISVPEKALSDPPKQIDYFSEEQQKIVDSVCNRNSELAKRAFQYWLEIMRWASENALIGQPGFGDVESGWSTYLMEATSSQRVWASQAVITVYREMEVTEQHWKDAERRLKAGDELPMHLRFLHDAETSKRNGQYQKSIIEIAIACEIYLRYAVLAFIPEETPEEFEKYIEEANINKFVSQFFRGFLDSSQALEYKAITKELSSLFSRRNSYLHMGKMSNADNDLCLRFINAARRLFAIKLNGGKI